MIFYCFATRSLLFCVCFDMKKVQLKLIFAPTKVSTANPSIVNQSLWLENTSINYSAPNWHKSPINQWNRFQRSTKINCWLMQINGKSLDWIKLIIFKWLQVLQLLRVWLKKCCDKRRQNVERNLTVADLT